MLHESPELVHRFYQDVSKLGRPEQNGIMGITTTMDVSSLSLPHLPADISCVPVLSCVHYLYLYLCL